MDCETTYARSNANQLWNLKKSNELLLNLKSQSISHINSIKTYYVSTLYATILQDTIKTRHFAIIDSCSFNKNGKKIFINSCKSFQNLLVRRHSDSTHKYSENWYKSNAGVPQWQYLCSFGGIRPSNCLSELRSSF